LLLGAAVVFFQGLRRGNLSIALVAVTLAAGGFLLSVGYGGGYFEKTSTKRLAGILRPMLKPEDRVYCVGTYTQDLPVYLERLISVVDYEGELQFGIRAEPEFTAPRYLKMEAFAQQWVAPGAAYAVVRKNFYDKGLSNLGIPYTVIASTEKFVLIGKSSPQP